LKALHSFLGSLIWFFDMTSVYGRAVFVPTDEMGQSPKQRSSVECFTDGPAVHLQSSVSGASRAHKKHPMVPMPISLSLMFTRRSTQISVRTTEVNITPTLLMQSPLFLLHPLLSSVHALLTSLRTTSLTALSAYFSPKPNTTLLSLPTEILQQIAQSLPSESAMA